MKTHYLSITLAGLFAASLLTGCATTGSNTSSAKYLDEVWVSPDLQAKGGMANYSKVYFAPVTVAELKKQSWWSSQSERTQTQIQADAVKLAQYLRNSLNTAARNYPGARLQVVGQPGPGTLVIESAITELVPAKVFWDVAATGAGFVVPGAGLLSTAGKGAIGIEGRMRDGGTGAVLATFRDRETDQIAVANLASYTWYHGSEANLDELAQKTAEALLNAPAGTVVKRSFPIKLIAF